MPDSPRIERSENSSSRAGAFPATRWSLLALAKDDAGAEQAIGDLCRAYWKPVYGELRRRGYSSADAQDLTQDFFARLLRRQSFGRADQSRGRFRSFLLAALDHLIADHWRDRNAQKRGAGEMPLSLNTDEGETWFREVASPSLSPGEAFDQNWALILMDRALASLREEYTASGRSDVFKALEPYLTADSGEDGYASVCGPIGLTPQAFAVAVHRLRRRFRHGVRAQVEMTVADPSEVDAEMKHLFGV
ncbi:MAG: sigma-70 family RNA polymerase sigma factor [Verrucomicrobiaceae bacterium]|nr:sigma-70 family RNA polymerase sigma factor [Verrucomicrobiaceae bacterium]